MNPQTAINNIEQSYSVQLQLLARTREILQDPNLATLAQEISNAPTLNELDRVEIILRTVRQGLDDAVIRINRGDDPSIIATRIADSERNMNQISRTYSSHATQLVNAHQAFVNNLS